MHSWNVSSRCSCKAFQLLSISPHPPQWNEPFPWVYSTWWSNQTWGLNSFAQIWHALCHSPNPYSSIYLFFWMEIQISTLHSDIQATCHALLWYAFFLYFLTQFSSHIQENLPSMNIPAMEWYSKPDISFFSAIFIATKIVLSHPHDNSPSQIDSFSRCFF